MQILLSVSFDCQNYFQFERSLATVCCRSITQNLLYVTASWYLADTSLYVEECKDYMRTGGFHIGWPSTSWSKCWCNNLSENSSLVRWYSWNFPCGCYFMLLKILDRNFLSIHPSSHSKIYTCTCLSNKFSKLS